MLCGEAEGQHGVCGQTYSMPSGVSAVLRQSRGLGSGGNCAFLLLLKNVQAPFVSVRKGCSEVSLHKHVERENGDAQGEMNDVLYKCEFKKSNLRGYPNLYKSKFNT